MKRALKSIIRPKTLLAWLTIFVLVGGLAALKVLGYLDPAIAFLDSPAVTFTVGSAQVSLYGILTGVAVLVVLFWVASIFSSFGERRLRGLRKLRASNRTLVIKGFQVGVYFITFLVALDVLGVDLTAFAVVGGAIGIGIGFGLQKITSNFISGLILLFEKSVEEGDLVELDDGTTGFVRYTGARYTLIETFESRDIMVPNEDFITNRVTNWTFSNSLGRIDINVGVAYGADYNKVSELMVEAAAEHPRCSSDPGPECFLVDFADSSVNFTLYFWVDDIIEGRKRPRSDVLFAIAEKFAKHGIEIPFPQRDLHIKSGKIA